LANNDTVIWCIRAGEAAQADSLFLQQGFIALGWADMGDLGQLRNDIETFKAHVRQHHPDYKPGAIPNAAGQLRRFTYDLKPSDLAVYPSKLDRMVHIGRIVGPYLYDPHLNADYPHRRKIEWLRAVPRTHFKQGALYEMGAIMTLFQIKNHADEFHAALVERPTKSASIADATVIHVAEDIEQNTRDYILKRLAQELKGHPLADFVAHLLTTMGYRTRVSTPGPDQGVDIVANKGELGFEPPLIKVQVKSSEGSIGSPTINELYGSVGPGEYGLFVTLGTFTIPARNTASTHSNLRLIDGDDLVDLILQHYEQVDARYKGILPLKRVYVPDPPEPEQDEG
jgi:restriction system protein